jgi:hypothetical protein
LYLQTLTPTLTTTAFDRSNLEWFEARSWKLASKGLPSSLTQLVHAQVSFSLRNLLFVRYGTHKTKPIQLTGGQVSELEKLHSMMGAEGSGARHGWH